MENPVVQYFSNIYKAFHTTFVGLSITLKHFFHIGIKPYTVQYPDVDLLAPPDAQSEAAEMSHRIYSGYRGLIEIDPDCCIACSACERACPIECILIEKIRVGKQVVVSAIDGSDRNRVNAPSSAIIDMSKCMFCGFCSEVCPTGALRHTRKFEGSKQDIDGLIYEFVSSDKKKELEEIAEKAAAEKAAADKKKAEADAKKAAEAKEEKPTTDGDAKPAGEEKSDKE